MTGGKKHLFPLIVKALGFVEKRLVLFILCSVIIFTGYGLLRITLLPPPPPDARRAEAPKGQDPDKKQKPSGKSAKKLGPNVTGDKSPKKEDAAPAEKKSSADVETSPAEKPDSKETTPAKPPGGSAIVADDKPTVPQTWWTLGSCDPRSPYRLLVTLTNRGGAVEKVELVERHSNGALRYRDLEHEYGYLGLECRDTSRGCEVTVVGPGTPAASAKAVDAKIQPGVLFGDVIQNIDGRVIDSRLDLQATLERTKPDQVIRMGVLRKKADSERRIEFSVTLMQRPLALITAEASPGTEPVLSFLLGLNQVGGKQLKVGQEELPGFASLRNSNWTAEKRGENEVAFRQRVPLGPGPEADQLEVIKRYQIVPTPSDQLADPSAPTYHLRLVVEVKNHGKQAHEIAYQMDGPTGLPTEGWWYSNKIHPSWGSAGARDVIWRVHDKKHSLRSASQIYKEATSTPDNPLESILSDSSSTADRTLDYLGVDTQYFSAVLLAGTAKSPTPFLCSHAYSLPVGPVPELKSREIRTLNTTFRFVTDSLRLEPNQSVTQQYHVFLGPKSPPLLDKYGLSKIIEYGWFGWIAKPMSRVLHFFYFIIRNYGLAIILLTVLVRGAMFPVGRKAARNAQMMQELAPQLKALKEKYKNDMEKQAQAQRELWKKHNFNPLGGCWLMFLQLPIFIGLYRCLSVDIELRQAPLIPGLRWCANLAGPDMFWYWETSGLAFLTSKNGWLGPYLNILPIVTVVLFIAQQKMFTPPATDDQSRMQQQMMKYMMVFMGVMFFKVPAGLCLYFIASSIWGIGERKLLPKPGTPTGDSGAQDAVDTSQKERKASRSGKGNPTRDKETGKKPRKSILQRIEQWQRLAEQKVNKPRPTDRNRRKKGKR